MRFTRRGLMKSGAAATATALTSQPAWSKDQPVLFVYDSRLTAGRTHGFAHSAPKVDVATQDEALWVAFRQPLGQGRIDGLTSWSDWVFIRGLLEEKGKRVLSEVKVGRHFCWSMA